MTEILTADQMRALEQAAMATGRVTGLDLMERAGRGVLEAVFAEWPELQATAHRAVVLCGSGNNGGDGFVVARLLKGWGWEVGLFTLALPATPEAQAMAHACPVAARDLSQLEWEEVRQADLAVDALFGTGLTRALSPGLAGTLEMLRAAARLVAVDVPSGLCADSGRFLAPETASDQPADLTVTFARPKLGHHLAEGPARCGKLVVVPIGVEAGVGDLLRKDGASVVEAAGVSPDDLAKRGGHKFGHGHALVLSGGVGRGGAGRLAARAALRVGAGLVTLGCPPAALIENAARLDAVMLRSVKDAAALVGVLADPRITALCLGPGLGLDARAADLVRAALEASRGIPRPTAPPSGVGRGIPRLATVLDADALTLISRDPDLFALLHADCVLTPHHGEFARLFPDIAAKLDAPATQGPARSKVDATREAAKRAGCVVLYKGPDTVIASPDGTCVLSSAAYDRAAPWLATAGSGDVLAGVITGLLARGFGPRLAAETAAWLHVEAARSFGPGLIAEDLPEELPKVFRALGL